jgi:hypothetical protein
MPSPKLSELPKEPQRTSSGRAIAVSFAVVVLAYALANVTTALWLDAAPQNVGYAVVEHKWQAVVAHDEPMQWLFLGDSSCNQGVMPERVEAALGGSAYNACTIGSATVADDAWMLSWLLEHDAAPANLVVIHTWDTWRRDDSTLRAMLYLVPSEAWRGREPRPSTSMLESLLARVGHWAPLASQPRSVYLLLTNAGRARIPESISIDEHGFMAMPFVNEAALERDARKHLSLVRSESFTSSEWSDEAIRTLLGDANDAGINTLLVMAPVFEGVLVEPEFAAYMGDYHAYLNELAGEYEHVNAQPNTPVALPSTQLEKVDHPTPAGAVVYTDAIIGWLAEPSL